MAQVDILREARCDVTLVTYNKFPNLTSDDALLRRALWQLGASVRVAIWDDPEVDWGISPITVVRSTWNYVTKVDSFTCWIAGAKTKTRLINSAKLLEWNVHKGYLHALERRGVLIVPTTFLVAGDTTNLGNTCRRYGWNDVVVKPAVSGSSFGTKRFSGPGIVGDGDRHLQRLLRVRDAMVQPYFDEVEGVRERGMIYLDGRFSHSYRKTPFSASLGGDDDVDLPVRSTSEEIAFGITTLAALEEVPTYARVDVLPTASGLRLMELELIDPALHLSIGKGADVALATSILKKFDEGEARRE